MSFHHALWLLFVFSTLLGYEPFSLVSVFIVPVHPHSHHSIIHYKTIHNNGINLQKLIQYHFCWWNPHFSWWNLHFSWLNHGPWCLGPARACARFTQGDRGTQHGGGGQWHGETQAPGGSLRRSVARWRFGYEVSNNIYIYISNNCTHCNLYASL